MRGSIDMTTKKMKGISFTTQLVLASVGALVIGSIVGPWMKKNPSKCWIYS